MSKRNVEQRRRDLCDVAIELLAEDGARGDIVLAHAPADTDALVVKRRALEQLLAASGRENHSEVQRLEQEIKSATIGEDQ